MDQRTLLAVILSLGIYYAWLLIKGPPPELALEPTEGVEATAPEPVAVPTPEVQPRPKSDIPIEEYDMLFCGAEMKWTNDGGALRSMKLDYQTAPFDVTPFYSYLFGVVTSGDLNWSPYGQDPGPQEVLSDQAMGIAIGTGTGPAYENIRLDVTEHSTDTIVATGTTSEGIGVTYTLKPAPTASDEPCQMRLDVTFKNSGGPYSGDLWLASHDDVPTVSGMFAMYQSNKQVTAYVDGDVNYGAYDEEDPEARVVEVEGDTTWIGVGDRYYAMMVLPDEPVGQFAFTSRETGPDAWLQGATFVMANGLDAGAEKTSSFRIYVGPTDTEVLGAVHEDLTQAVDLGWFAFFGYPLLFLMKIFHEGTGNWGVSIILLTLLMKLLLFPLTQTAFKSSQAMQAIQPQMKDINERLADNPEEKQKAIMALFKENNVNPLGGCLPMIIQMPIWFALYRVLLSSVELYHTEFLYLRDLSSPDPYGVLPAIVVVLMLIQQQFTPMGNMDPAQARMMKLMPLAFGVFFFTFPSGLVVYIFVNMLLSILQQWFIRRTFKGPEGPASVEPAPAA